MACIPIPQVVAPELGFGLSLTPPQFVDPEFNLELCCKILQFQIPLPPIPLPPLVVNASTGALLGQVVGAINSFLDQLAFECPKE